MIFSAGGLFFFLALPLLLIPVEYLLPYPYLIEEMAKLLLIHFFYNRSKNQYINIILAGILFTVSESYFYLTNIINYGDITVLFRRILLTGLLHICTTVCLYLGYRQGGWRMMVGLIVAVCGHYLFNLAGF